MILSIITVNYNDVLGLTKTLASVRNQTFSGFEHIVIDGGSTDGSKELIESNKEHISYWVSEPDAGIYNAMNKGIAQSKGEYVLFLNSGDWLVSSEIIKTVTVLLGKSDIVYGNYIRWFSEGNKILYKGINGSKITLKTLFDGNCLPHTASFIKRNLFEKFGNYDESLKIVSDWKFFIDTILIKKVSVQHIDFTISSFSMDGISNQNKLLLKEEQVIVLKELFPDTIYTNYSKAQSNQDLLDSNRFLILRYLESSKSGKKIASFILRALLLVIKGKQLKDLKDK